MTHATWSELYPLYPERMDAIAFSAWTFMSLDCGLRLAPLTP